MTTQDMSIAQLWKAHHANPNNTVIRNAIALRDPSGAKQLWPISRQCNVTETARVISDLEDDRDEFKDRAVENESEAERVPGLESEIEDLEDTVEKLETKVQDLESELAEARQ